MRNHFLRRVSAVVVLSFVEGAAFAQHEEADRLQAATGVFEAIMDTPDNAVPASIFERAEAIAVIPNTVKAGFIFGAHRGRGVISARDGLGEWSQPAFLTMTGGSFGLQIGGQSVDVVLVILNRDGLDKLLRNEFKFGGDASAVVGPVGREVEVATDLFLHAQILSYSRSRGLFAGITLKGSTIRADRGANERFYGLPYTSGQLVLEAAPTTPFDAAAVAGWQALLARHSY